MVPERPNSGPAMPGSPVSPARDRAQARREHFWAAARRLERRERDPEAASGAGGEPLEPARGWHRIASGLLRRRGVERPGATSEGGFDDPLRDAT